MKTLSYLLLDAFVVFLALAILWYIYKKCASVVTCSTKVAKQLFVKRKTDKKKSLRQARSGATPVKDKPIESCEMQAETRILTPARDPIDWSQYDSPAFMRKGVLIH